MLDVLKWFFENWVELLGGISAAVAALLAVALIIPGEHPDKELQWLVDLLKKISRK